MKKTMAGLLTALTVLFLLVATASAQRIGVDKIDLSTQSCTASPSGKAQICFNGTTLSCKKSDGSSCDSGGSPNAQGFVNAKTNCGVTGDGTTVDDIAGCAASNVTRKIFLPKLRTTACSSGSGGGCIGTKDYYITAPIILADAQTLECESSANWPNGGVKIKVAPGVVGLIMAGVSSKMKGCIFDQEQYWNSADSRTFEDIASLNGAGVDCIQAVGGEFEIDTGACYGFSRHGLLVAGDGSIPGYGNPPNQPDGFSIKNFVAYSNRGWGVYFVGGDSNAGYYNGIKTWGNMLGGVYDNSQLGNTGLGLMSHVDHRGNLSAGSNKTITGESVTSNVKTVNAVAHGWLLNQWITTTGEVDGTFSGTCRITLVVDADNVKCNFTHANGPTTGGTGATSSATQIYAYYTAKGGVFARMGAFAGPSSSSSTQVHVNPYCESTSGGPMPGGNSLILGGDWGHSCLFNIALGSGLSGVWLNAHADALEVKATQGMSYHNPTDGGNAFISIKSGTSSTGSRGVRFLKHDDTIDFRLFVLTTSQVGIDCGALGGGLTITKTQYAVLNPCTMSQDIRFHYNNGAVTGKTQWYNDTTKTAELDPAIGRMSPALFGSLTNCSSSAAPAVCAAAPAGSVVVAAAATTVVVNTTAVTANSQIFLQNDSGLGTKLGVTCNTQSSLVLGTPRVTARTAGTSFTITLEVAPTTNPMCISYQVVN